ncbi:hypothetical protein [Tamlana sp. I1]|uniref:hypothetical protein n=1 Tax=Tamlana sp. I1 TaxID=2762061 RepID=UPI00188EC585|nr:hypothetical protein [Tamlana sp. I1]
MSYQKKILFLVPDGVGVKNYLYSKVISYLKQTNVKIVIWSPLPEAMFKEVSELHQVEIDYKKIKLHSESVLTRFYREATTYARLLRNSKLKQNPTILSNWKLPDKNMKLKALYLAAMLLGRYLAKDYNRILAFEAKSKKFWSKKIIGNYRAELDSLQPHSIFITHQRVANLMPICLAAKTLKIKVVSAIFSWDNLPKARLCIDANIYLVWSEWMKNEMADYYPEIPKEQVKLVGTPQFEFYLDGSQKLDRAVFAKQYGLDPNKQWVCFSGDDVKTSPFDALYFNDVVEALKPYNDTIQIIFRRCPVDFSDRYDEVINSNKGFVFAIDPLWHIPEGAWTGYVSKYEDVSMQVNLALHCDVVVNLGSTMAHDFTMYGKPCLYLKYNPVFDANWSVERIYQFQHFRSMGDLDAVGWILNRESIATQVLKAIQYPNEIGRQRKVWMEKIVLHPIKNNSELIAKEIL